MNEYLYQNIYIDGWLLVFSILVEKISINIGHIAIIQMLL